MATVFLPNAKAFLPSLPYASSSTVHAQAVCCRAATEASSSLVISRRTIFLSTLLFTTLRGCSKGRLDEANAAILEADDDEELLEKVKKDRKKRLERQGVISSSAKETGTTAIGAAPAKKGDGSPSPLNLGAASSSPRTTLATVTPTPGTTLGTATRARLAGLGRCRRLQILWATPPRAFAGAASPSLVVAGGGEGKGGGAYLQDLVYKLSKVGQAIEKNDLSAAGSVLGSSKDTEWVQKVNSAFNKLSSSDEEKTEVDTFNSSLASLISSVSSNDIEASKVAFVASATAFEKWSNLSGLVEQLKGFEEEHQKGIFP
ncbi:UNVERIFIED_CONTAM: Thylakoid lumenal protein, chloroplastic [Sesamum calycinum]|uniref:Thylakoid lumenal protein, chloroplastic n=1 Tax=Sesamum calycinum TaxID=2727403 RepID=A0AAW2N3J7_9LAMI